MRARDLVRAGIRPAIRAWIQRFPNVPGTAFAWRTVGRHFQFPRARIAVPTHRGFQMVVDPSEFIEGMIYFTGHWEPNLSSFIAARLEEGDVFVDVGANVGWFTLLASREVGESGQVVAVEASERNRRKLTSNLELNRCTNVEVIAAAAAEERGELSFFETDWSNHGQNSLRKIDGATEVRVMAAPLDELLSPSIRRRARIVKIDVEGAEWRVVMGMSALLEESRPDLEVIVEVTPTWLKEAGSSVDELFRPFLDAGFRPYRLRNRSSIQGYLEGIEFEEPSLILDEPTDQVDVIFSRSSRDTLALHE